MVIFSSLSVSPPSQYFINKTHGRIFSKISTTTIHSILSLNNRTKRFIDQTDTPLFCDRFINPIMDNNTFFSPLDLTAMVDTYPPNAFCTFVLEGKCCVKINY